MFADDDFEAKATVLRNEQDKLSESFKRRELSNRLMMLNTIKTLGSTEGYGSDDARRASSLMNWIQDMKNETIVDSPVNRITDL